MDLWESVSFFKNKIDEVKSEMKIPENKRKYNLLNNKLEHYKNALHCICSKIKGPFTFSIMWEELGLRKGKPIYVREKQGNEWFGWWDILDTVSKSYISTAYSDELKKEDKGIIWEIYDFEATKEIED